MVSRQSFSKGTYDVLYLASQVGRLLGCTKQLFCLFALHVFHFREVEVAHAWAAEYDPISVVLFARYGVAHQCQIHQLLKPCQRVQITQFCNPVLRQDERLQVRYARREVRLDIRYPVLGEEQCAEAGLQGEVAELCNVVVGEVDHIVVLRGISELHK